MLFASVLTTQTIGRCQSVCGSLMQTNVYWNQIMAAALVVCIPVVIGFLLAQRHFVAGVTAGAVK